MYIYLYVYENIKFTIIYNRSKEHVYNNNVHTKPVGRLLLVPIYKYTLSLKVPITQPPRSIDIGGVKNKRVDERGEKKHPNVTKQTQYLIVIQSFQHSKLFYRL